MVKKIVIATVGSLGDLHPKLAIGIELQKRGYDVTIAAMEIFREKVETLDLRFCSLSPHFDLEKDRDLAGELIDGNDGIYKITKDFIMGNIKPMYEDLLSATSGADVIITGQTVYAVQSVIDKTGIKWVSTSLAPQIQFSIYDPPVFPLVLGWDTSLFRPLGPLFHKILYLFIRILYRGMLVPYKQFRKELRLRVDHDPVMTDMFSNDLHLAMFSNALGKPQLDWPSNTVQTGVCFYDGNQNSLSMPDGLDQFLNSNDAPIVFTVGSIVAFAPGKFFEESIKAAKILNKRAVLLYGQCNTPPSGMDENIVGYGYAPYSKVFSKASIVVHHGGVGTTHQVLQAGVPMLVVPFSFDQPDNAHRCQRLGVARVIRQKSYSASKAAKEIKILLDDPRYLDNAKKVKQTLDSEKGTQAACDAIETLFFNSTTTAVTTKEKVT